MTGTTPAAPPPADLVGAWRTFESRSLDLVVRVTSRKRTGRGAVRETVAEYRVARAAVTPEGSERAAWHFQKQLPDVQAYRVALHHGGRVTCDCPHHEFAHPDEVTLCVHESCALTIADAFKELVLPADPLAGPTPAP